MSVGEKMTSERQTEIHDKIMQLLEQGHFTVEQVKAILLRCERTIYMTAEVQFDPAQVFPCLIQGDQS